MSFQTNSRIQLNNNEIYLINMLNTMYTNNNRLMDHLVTTNNEIRSMIQNIIQQNIQNNRNNRNQRTYRNNNERQSYFTHSNSTRMDPYSSLLLNVLFPDETSYIIDYIQPNYEASFMEPVPVYPSQEQIENATSTLLYREIENPLNHSCPISLEPFHENDSVTMIKYCGHIFKPTEIQSWFQNNVRCPICRYDIRTFSSSSSSSSSSSTNRNINENTNTNTNTTTNPSTENPRRQIRTTSQERNNNTNNTRHSVRILQRGESYNNNGPLLDQLFTTLWRNSFITDLSNNTL